ncbi:hypothetical protein FRC09_009660, partial [Ceratobasidium sp. 395]
MPRKSKKSLAATKREKLKKAERSNQLDTQVLSHNDLESDREDSKGYKGYKSDNQVLEESVGGGNTTGFESDADEPEVEIGGTKETLYEHLYRNQIDENHVGKRARAESDPVATTPGDTTSVKPGVGQIPATKKAKIDGN